MKTFKEISQASYASVSDVGTYTHYFCIKNGQLMITNEDIGDISLLDKDEQNDCLLSREDSIALAQYLYNNLIKDKSCATSKTKSKK